MGFGNAHAKARFDAVVPADVADGDFAGFRAASWQVDGLFLRDRPQYLVWVADCVFVYSMKVDDTPLGSNPSLVETSDRMLDWILDCALPQCFG